MAIHFDPKSEPESYIKNLDSRNLEKTKKDEAVSALFNTAWEVALIDNKIKDIECNKPLERINLSSLKEEKEQKHKHLHKMIQFINPKSLQDGEIKEDMQHVLIYLLQEGRFEKFKELNDNTYSYGLPKKVCDVENELFLKAIKDKDSKKIARLLACMHLPSFEMPKNKAEFKPYQKGSEYFNINQLAHSEDNYFLLGMEFEEIERLTKKQNDSLSFKIFAKKASDSLSFKVFCEVAQDLWLAKDIEAYVRLKKQILNSKASPELKDAFKHKVLEFGGDITELSFISESKPQEASPQLDLPSDLQAPSPETSSKSETLLAKTPSDSESPSDSETSSAKTPSDLDRRNDPRGLKERFRNREFNRPAFHGEIPSKLETSE